MNNLTDDLFSRVIKNLDLPEKIKFRRVSMSWYSRINQILNVQQDLAICDYYSINNRWFISNDLIDYRNDIIPNQKFFPSLSLFASLRRFKHKFELFYDDLKVLEQFLNLEQLEIGILSFGNHQEPIRLLKLQVLCIYSHSEVDNRLTFDTPNLRSLFLGSDVINHFTLLDYLSVEYLQFERDAIGDSFQFQNAQIIQCDHFLDINLRFLLKLLNLPNLLELHLNVERLYCLTDHNYHKNDLKEMKQAYGELITAESKLKRNVTIFIEGIPICLAMSFEDYEFSGSTLNLHHSMRSLLNAQYSSVKRIDFKIWLDIVEEKSFSRYFYTRYPAIQDVSLIQPDRSLDHRLFIKFLEGFNKLSALVISNTEFGQEFYDALPAISSLTESMSTLKIYDKIDQTRLTRIRFAFLTKFEYLRHFGSNLVIKKILLRILPKLKYPNMHSFHFDFNEFNNVLIIKRSHRDLYKFTISVKDCRENVDRDSVYKFKNLSFDELSAIFEYDKLAVRYLKHKLD